MTKVLFHVPIREEQLKELEKDFPNVEFIRRNSEESVEDLLPAIDIWVTYGMNVKKEHIDLAKNLKWIAVYSAGVDKLPWPEVQNRNIFVTNVRGIHRHCIAEQVFAYVLSHERKLIQQQEQQKNNVWDRQIKPGSLYGKRMGIIGTGAIGQEIARKAKAFDMRTIGVRKTPKDTEYMDEMYSLEKFHQVLSLSDYVIMVLPLTLETKHIMDKDAFKAMKRNGYFVNIARGEVVNTPDLMWAIEENIIAGAALDVFEEEPLPKDHPLWSLENIVITPHTAGLFPDYIKRSNDIFKYNLEIYIKNRDGIEKEKMMNVVDPKKGY